MHKPKTLLALAGAAAVSLGAASASAQDATPPSVSAKEVGACIDAKDRAECLAPLINRANRSMMLASALKRPNVQAAELKAATDRYSPRLDPQTSDVLAETLNADQGHQDSAAVLARSDPLPSRDRAFIYASICTRGIRPPIAGHGPRFVALLAGLRPTAALAKSVGDRWEHDLATSVKADPTEVVGLLACRFASQDTAGTERALKLIPTDAGLRLLLLTAARRYDDALALATSATPADVVTAQVSDKSFPPTLFPWVFLQRERLRLMQNARLDDRPDVARATADLLLAAAVAPDRPESHVAQTGVPEALGFVILNEDKAAATPWLEQLDAVTRPGQRGWNYEDAAAVYRGWLSIGRTERAESYYGSFRPNGEMISLKKGDDQEELFRLDIIAGAADQTLKIRLAHARSETERAKILSHCAVPFDMFDAMKPFTPFLPLDTAARCARDLAAMPPIDPEGQRKALETLSKLPAAPEHILNPSDLQALTERADAEYTLSEEEGRKREAAVTVAVRASQADDLALANEMLSIALRSWRDTLDPHATLSSRDAVMLNEIVTLDRLARGIL